MTAACLWTPALTPGACDGCPAHRPSQPLLLCAGTYRKGPTLQLHTAHLPSNCHQLKSELCPGWDSAVALGVPARSPPQFNSEDPSEEDSQLITSNPASHPLPLNHGNGSHFCEIKMFCISKPDVPRVQKPPLRLRARPSLAF